MGKLEIKYVAFANPIFITTCACTKLYFYASFFTPQFLSKKEKKKKLKIFFISFELNLHESRRRTSGNVTDFAKKANQEGRGRRRKLEQLQMSQSFDHYSF